MKKIVFLLIVAVSLVGCATEENLEGNDLKGGELAAVPCETSLIDNILVMDGSTLNIASGGVYYSSPSAWGDFHEYRVSLPAPYQILYIRLSAAQPVETGVYAIGESTAAESPEAGYAYLSVLDDTGTFYYSGVSNDKIYVTVHDGVPTFELCDVDMFHYSTYTFGITGRVGVAPVPEVPCSEAFQDNVLTLGDQTLAFTANDVDYSAPAPGGDFYEYRVSLPSPFRMLYIRLSADQAPAGNLAYAVTESTAAESPAAGYAYLSVLDENGRYYYSGESDDKLYVTANDGVITFELCDLDMFHYATYTFGITGRVVYGSDSDDSTAPCSDNLKANKLVVDTTPLTFSATNIAYTRPNPSGDFHEYRVTLPSPYRMLYLRFSSAAPLADNSMYTVVESTAAKSPKPGEVYLAILDEEGTFHYSGVSSDKVYVRVQDGAVTFDLCDLDMFYYYTYAFTMTGRIAQ